MALAELAVVLLIPVLFYKLVLYPAFFSPLSKIPNAHFTSPYSNGWIQWQRFRGRENRAIHDAHTRLGPIVKLGSTEISTNSLDALKVVYSDAFDKHVFYKGAFENYDTPNMFTTYDKKLHNDRRRILAGIYKKTTIQSSPEVQKIALRILNNRALPILEAASTDQMTFDALELSLAISMDFISAYLFGLSCSSNFVQDVKARRQWLAAMRTTKGHEFWAVEYPGLVSALSNFGINLVPPEVDTALEEARSLCLQLMDRAESSAEMGVSFEQLSRQLNPLFNDKAALGRTIASEHMDNMLAGTETTGWSLTYILYELSQNQNIQSSLQSELRSLSPPFTYDPASSSTELPSIRSLDALPLLDAVILESLRLHPAVPGPQPRVSPSPSVSLDGYDNIPPGIRVSAQAYTLHRNPSVFPDPESWIPERWVRASQEEKSEMMRWFWAFGSGSRMCIGNAFALHELKLIIASIYTNYRTHIVDDAGIEQRDGFTTGPKGNKLILRIERV